MKPHQLGFVRDPCLISLTPETCGHQRRMNTIVFLRPLRIFNSVELFVGTRAGPPQMQAVEWSVSTEINFELFCAFSPMLVAGRMGVRRQEGGGVLEKWVFRPG